jgi:hypothetical protein
MSLPSTIKQPSLVEFSPHLDEPMTSSVSWDPNGFAERSTRKTMILLKHETYGG